MITAGTRRQSPERSARGGAERRPEGPDAARWVGGRRAEGGWSLPVQGGRAMSAARKARPSPERSARGEAEPGAAREAMHSARGIARGFAFRDQRPQQGYALWRDPSAGNRCIHFAARFAVVATIAEPALAREVAELDERIGEHFARTVREAEHLHARRIDDPSIAARKPIQRRRGRRVAAASQRLRKLADARARARHECVDERRLAHARLSDDDAMRGRDEWEERRDIVSRRETHHLVTERGVRREA